MKKHIKFLSVIILIAVTLSGCSYNTETKSSNGKIKIIASLFPQYDFAKQIAKDKAEVTLLLPPGTESHTFDPTPADIMKISNSDVFLYTGKYMEPWVEKLISGIDNKNLNIVDTSIDIDLIENEHHHEDEKIEEHEDHGKYDPHIWLDPVLAGKMVDNILVALCKQDPENADFYRKNANEYKQKLSLLDSDIKNEIENAKRKTIVFASRFACGYFIKRYNLTYKSVISGCSAESEPSVKKIASVLNFIKENNIPIVYYEELTTPKIAESICNSAKVKALRFSTCHNLSRNDFDNGVTYIDMMRENLENLKMGLN